MTEAAPSTEEVETNEQEELDGDEQEFFVDHWLGSVPLFIASKGEDVDELIEDVREQGFSVFYILAEVEHKHTTKGKHGSQYTQYIKKPRVLKVVNNLIGHGVTEVNEGTVGLAEASTVAYFTLPSIPYDLIHDIDDFFREVNRKYSTEAVVLLTYDPAYQDSDDPSEGWGVLVPEQKNSAGSCEYDPMSVVDDKPDEIFIVGSAHSHPGMKAYCSGVDARDQADFDGIHITFGWSKGDRTTEYYIELQMGGGSFVMQPEQVFTEVDEPIENEKIKAWTEKVSKKTFTHTKYATGYGYDFWDDAEKFKNLPDACPTPEEVSLIVAPLLGKDEWEDCLVCESTITKYDLRNLQCFKCKAFLQPTDVSFEELVQVQEEYRKSRSTLTAKPNPLDISKRPRKAIWYWRETVNDTKDKITEEIFPLWDPDEKDKGGGGQSGKASGRGSSDDGTSAVLELWCGACGAFNDHDGDECTTCNALLIRSRLRTCTACGEPNFKEDYACAFCRNPLGSQERLPDTSSSRQDDLRVIDCPNPRCDSRALLGEDVCWTCGTDLEEPSTYLMESSEEGRPRPWYLCCGNLASACECPPHEILSFKEADEHLIDSDVVDIHDIYDQGTACMRCQFLFDADCVPYRTWLTKWVKDDEVSPAITPCDNFLPVV